MESVPSMKHALVVATALKILLFPAYHSTDFEVHRNWLAITHSLPVSKWYFEKTSEWTLDYPPFFAYFEYLLSQFAQIVDPLMLTINNLNYASWQTIAFQRYTVIITELVLFYSLLKYIDLVPLGSRSLAQAAALSIFLSPGLLLIDHIHFQYNGMMYGLLILSLALARKPSTTLLSGILFAVLLCFKHIYLYLAPAYFVFLLRSYCLGRSIFSIRFTNCIKLGLSLGAVFGAAFGPFIAWGQVPQLLSRLFPFARGLTHAYWAPNAWAIYSFIDRVLIYLAPRLGLAVNKAAAASLTRGLVGDVQFAVLPEITSGMTFVLTLLAMIPPLIKLFLTPTWRNFVSSVTLCAYASFLFGYHVHEKAILLVLLPFSMVALTDRRYLSAFSPLTTAGHVSIFPLLFDAETWLIKFMYTACWILAFNVAFERIAPAPEKGMRIFILDRLTMMWNLVAIPLIAYCSLIHSLIFGERFEFLPLMFISTYCALGVVSSWVGFLVVYFTAPILTRLEGVR